MRVGDCEKEKEREMASLLVSTSFVHFSQFRFNAARETGKTKSEENVSKCMLLFIAQSTARTGKSLTSMKDYTLKSTLSGEDHEK